jgi:Uma2 family endonuclease
MSVVTAETLLTAEEYLQLPDNGQPTELVSGKVVPVNMPKARHGQICGRTAYLLQRFLEDHDLGHVLSNDTGVPTRRGPDTVRGADIAFYSYAKVPKGPLPNDYLPVPPEVVFEVRSPGDRWSEIHAKVGEYLTAGVQVVCVLDDQTETAHVFPADDTPRTFAGEQELLLPGVLAGLRVAVRRFFA